VRLVLFLPAGLVLFGCAAAPTEEIALRAHDDTPFVLELPRPGAEGESARAALPRSSIATGVYALELSSSDSHGCSRSWQTTSTQVKATLEITAGVATLDLTQRSHTTSGSRAMGAEPTSYVHNTVAKLRGTFTEIGPGKLSASLSSVSCEGDCPSGNVDIVCEQRHIALDRREPTGDAVEAADAGKDGSIEGLVCTGFGSVVGGGRASTGELPFGAGAGVEVAHADYGFGPGAAKTYRARVATP
jgi:hypothetical protein